MKTKVNKVPLVGPRGRRELLDKIEELEKKVAQQDYIVINVNDLSDLTQEETEQIVEHIQNGTIMDCLIKDEQFYGTFRVVSYSEEGGAFVVISPDGDILSINYV